MLELDDTPTAQCGACHGTGIDQSHGYDCEQCQGDGWVYVLEPASKTHGGAQAMTHTSTEQREALRLASALRGYKAMFIESVAADFEAAAKLIEASQAQRVPLSKRKIRQIDAHSGLDAIEFARAIERAHGITQEKQG